MYYDGSSDDDKEQNGEDKNDEQDREEIDIWHKLRYFMLLKGHKSRKETTPNRKQGALPPVCQFYHCHPIGPDIETS